MKAFRIIIWLVLLTIILALAGSFYLYTVYLPKRLYNTAVATLTGATARKVAIAQAKVEFPKGVVLKDIVIYESDQQTEFVRIKELNCKIFILPLIKDKKVIIPFLNLIEPKVSINRTKEGLWNFADLAFLKEPTLRSDETSFFVYRVNVRHASVAFKDDFVAPPFEQRLREISGSAYIGLPADVKFRCSLALDNSPARIRLNGGYNFLRKLFYLNCLAKELMPVGFAAYYQDKLPFQVRSATMNPIVKFACYNDGRSRLLLTTDFKNLSIFTQNYSADGDGRFEIDTRFNFKEKARPIYDGEMELNPAEISGLRGIGSINEVKAKVDFTQDRIELERFSCKVFQNRLEAKGRVEDYLTAPRLDLSATYAGIPVSLSAKVQDLSSLAFSASAQTQLDLARIKDLAPQNLKERLKDTLFSGDCAIKAASTGAMLPQFSYDLSGTAKITNAAIENPNLPDKITNISGVFNFGKDFVQFDKIPASFKNELWTVSGRIQNFALPEARLLVSSPNLKFDSLLAFKDDAVNISECEGIYRDINFDLTGSISNLADPYLDISGNTSFDLKDLPKFFPKYGEKLRSAALFGKALCSFNLAGKAKTPKEWALDLGAHSDEINAYGFAFQNVNIDSKIANRKIYVSRLSAQAYGGTIDARASAEISEENSAFALDAGLLDADISKLKEATPLKDKDIYGSLNAKLALSGVLNKPQTYAGDGWVRIRNGYLWESPILNMLAGIVYLPAQARVVFKDAAGTFQIKDERVYSHDLALSSDELALVADGSVGFDQTLDFDIGINLGAGLASTLDLTRLGDVLVAEAGDLLMDLKLKGTLREPKFTKKLSAEKILKEKVIKKIPQLLQDIFQ